MMWISTHKYNNNNNNNNNNNKMIMINGYGVFIDPLCQDL